MFLNLRGAAEGALISRRVNSTLGGFLNSNKMQIARLLYPTLAATALLVCFTPICGQIENQKIFNVIPLPQRERFVSRLNLYIEFSLSNQQDKLEALFDEKTLCSACKGKRECVDNCAPPMQLEVPEGFNFLTLALKPLKVARCRTDADWDYVIDIQQKERVSWKGNRVHVEKSKVRLFAVYQRGDWYFSFITIQGMVYL